MLRFFLFFFNLHCKQCFDDIHSCCSLDTFQLLLLFFFLVIIECIRPKTVDRYKKSAKCLWFHIPVANDRDDINAFFYFLTTSSSCGLWYLSAEHTNPGKGHQRTKSSHRVFKLSYPYRRALWETRGIVLPKRNTQQLHRLLK